MPLIFDPEYQAELERLRTKTVRNDKALSWVLLYMIIGFTAGFGALRAVGADAPTMISAIIAIASIGLAYIVIKIGVTLHATLVLNGAAVEWVGRKQLGEYQAPASSPSEL